MTTPLTDDEARRVTTCGGCDHEWRAHHDDGCYTYECPCTRADETLAQVAALKADAVRDSAAPSPEVRRLQALTLACQALVNSEGSTAGVVIRTAGMFEAYLSRGQVPR